jgi:hypothetical protein
MDPALPFFFVIIPIIIAIQMVGLAFWIWMIIDCATNEPPGDDSKLIWILVIVLASWVGALIYYFVRRPERIQKYGR